MGTIYLNEEAYGGGGVVDYSTSEQDTGKKWIDGRPIYSKTIYVSTLANGANVLIDSDFTPTIYDVAYVTFVKWTYTSSGNVINVMSNRGANASNGFIMVHSGTTNGLKVFYLNGGNAYPANDIYLNIEYTKVADLPQS